MKNNTKGQEYWAFFNPPFMAFNIHAMVAGFCKNDIAAPYSVIFPGLALALHKETRLVLPKSANARFQNWVQENEEILIELPDRVRALRNPVRQGLTFGYSHGILSFSDQGSCTPNRLPRGSNSVKELQEVRECLNASTLIGKLFGKAGDDKLIFYLLGIKP